MILNTYFKLTLVMLIFVACKQKEANSVISEQKTNENKQFLDSLDQANFVDANNKEIEISKLHIQKEDSSLYLNAFMQKDHRIFAYKNADIKSKRVLILSIFTSDVENNPFKCELGAYYSTQEIKNFKLKYNKIQGDFIKIDVIDSNNDIKSIYLEKNWIEFD